MNIALYKTGYGSNILFETRMMDGDDKYIQITEPVDVEFIPLDNKAITEQEIIVIDKKIKTVKAATQIELNQLEQRKAELLAIPDMSNE
ncbi:MAG: hypothetical protein KAT62_03525 [Desulfuromonadales bacterium]|nr:hypothetical protein [Desulfuromonadales bacterium]